MTPTPPFKPNLKRKQPSSNAQAANPNRSAKRVKVFSARTILSQTSDKALNKSGELDVSAFVKAREYEIKALEASMGASKKALSTRAFQQVPRQLRRRTASHNVKRVPKRLRARAAKEMKDDNTPPVTARSRNPTARIRLRAQEAKKIRGIAALARAKREAARTKKGVVVGDGIAGTAAIILPKPKKDILTKPPKPTSKFRKRQIHKQWLPTHLFHAKRAHMTLAQEPLWRFAIPTTPTEKSYRVTHRAGWMRGCVAWDMSYMSTIGVEGVEASLVGVLRCLGLPEDMLKYNKGVKWRRGTRSWRGWLRERDGSQQNITIVEVVWCLSSDGSPGAHQDSTPPSDQKAKTKRSLIIRVHPSAFLQLWNEVLKLAKMQRPAASVEDLRFEIGSIEIMGPGASEALAGALHPILRGSTSSHESNSPEQMWPCLAGVTNSASLPLNALLGFEISDPRLHHPPRTVELPKSTSATDGLLQILASWPPDTTQTTPTFFSRTARLTASRLLPSQKSINRRKGSALPGAYPSPLSTDPHIPILLLASRPETGTGQGSWTLLLPWKCVVPVWYALTYYPLSTGGNPRFGGLQEKRQICFEQGVPWFPGDFPGTKAGWEWEVEERERRKAEWEKRPRGKRVEWESVDLGRGRKGEVGVGWACDWERLFTGVPVSEVPAPTEAAEATSMEESGVPPPEKKHVADGSPPLGIHHLSQSQSLRLEAPLSPTALATVAITLLHRGVPKTCARIYRFPTTDAALRAQWLALRSASPKKSHKNPPSAKYKQPSKDAPVHVKRAELAASLLDTQPTHSDTWRDPSMEIPVAGDPNYPPVPGEEDLIGFVTTGNFNLGEGRGTGIGCIVLAKVWDAAGKGKGKERGKEGLCIVREAGMSLGRVAQWEAV
ncbi:hypothetical protein MMC30_007605 [Trapelia coarctata]|nr:hypothetical protein [Trapelia coarctata]